MKCSLLLNVLKRICCLSCLRIFQLHACPASLAGFLWASEEKWSKKIPICRDRNTGSIYMYGGQNHQTQLCSMSDLFANVSTVAQNKQARPKAIMSL